MPSRASANNLLGQRARRPVLHLLPKTQKALAPGSRDDLDFDEARKELIRNAAYASAAKRGSTRPQIDDWVAAEAEIDRRLSQ
jgi:Protein of unknown function (DUF2934)